MNIFCGELCGLFAEHPLLLLVTIVARQGSAPRASGARMLVLPNGAVMGSVGGGRCEAESILAAKELLAQEKQGAANGGPTRGLLLDVSLKGANDMDMLCGGNLTLLLEPLSALRQDGLFVEARGTGERGEPFAFITRICEQESTSAPSRGIPGSTPVQVERSLFLQHGGLWRQYAPSGRKNGAPSDAALVALQSRASAEPELLALEDGAYLLEYFPRPHRLYVFGAGHVSRALAELAHRLDFRITVLDDRPEFANRERFPSCRAETLASLGREHAAAFLAGCSIGAGDGIVIVTRGHAHDRDVLAAALDTGAGYIGMIGSKSKRAGVYAALREAGFSPEDFVRVRAPIGLSIDAETPEEIAVSIAAELIQWRNGRPKQHGFILT